MIEREIDKSSLMDVIEYELYWRDRAHKAEIEEKNKEILRLQEEILRLQEEILRLKEEENAKLKTILIENGIPF